MDFGGTRRDGAPNLSRHGINPEAVYLVVETYTFRQTWQPVFESSR